jgi:3-oxoadipate enol-lactonase
MPWIDTAGIALRYEVTGTGPETLLLLHEMGGSLESWDPLLPLLAPRFRIIRHDQRNAGLSEKPLGPMTIDQSGRDAIALLDALGVTEPVVVIGTAVGGALALHLAATFPDRVRAAIVTSPATGVPASARQGVLDRAARLERDGLRAGVDDGLALSYPPVLRGDAARFAAVRAHRMGIDPAGFAATLRMLADLDMTAELPRIACPVLVIAGQHDLTRPPERVAPVAEAIPGAVFRVLESGHFMALQTPELLAEAILTFLEGQ